MILNETNKHILVSKIKQELLLQSFKYSNMNNSLVVDENDVCSILICKHPVYKNGLCSGHLRRQKSNNFDETPIRVKDDLENCLRCQRKMDNKSAWNHCSRCYKIKRKDVIKKICVEFFNNKCNKCNNTYHHRVIDFRYLRDKMDLVTYVMSNFSIERIVEELSKCEAICGNCHRGTNSEIARIENIKILDTYPLNDFPTSSDFLIYKIKLNYKYQSSLYVNTPICRDCGDKRNTGGCAWGLCNICYAFNRRSILKKICVDHLGGKCNRCSEVFPSSLFDFHHIRDKDIELSILFSSKGPETIAKEILKCVLMCHNCHRLEHLLEW